MLNKLARSISYLFDPTLVWPVFTVLILFGTGLSEQLNNWLIFLVFCFELLGPLAVIIYLRKTGHITDWEITKREERERVFVYSLLPHLASLLLIVTFGTELAWQIRLSAFIIEVAGTLITLYWKISVHLANYTAVAFIAIVLFGWQWWPLLIVIPVLAWARVRRKKHTWLQTIAGTVLTLISFTGLFIAFGII